MDCRSRDSSFYSPVGWELGTNMTEGWKSWEGVWTAPQDVAVHYSLLGSKRRHTLSCYHTQTYRWSIIGTVLEYQTIQGGKKYINSQEKKRKKKHRKENVLYHKLLLIEVIYITINNNIRIYKLFSWYWIYQVRITRNQVSRQFKVSGKSHRPSFLNCIRNEETC